MYLFVNSYNKVSLKKIMKYYLAHISEVSVHSGQCHGCEPEVRLSKLCEAELIMPWLLDSVSKGSRDLLDTFPSDTLPSNRHPPIAHSV